MPNYYYQLIFTVLSEKADEISMLLSNGDALAVSLLESGENPLYETELDKIILWDSVRFEVLFETFDKAQKEIIFLENYFKMSFDYQIEKLENQDWITLTQAQFLPKCFGEKLWIYPEWYADVPEKDLILKLAPGLAFGTGTHPTTQMCLKKLTEIVTPNAIVIDFGCGSGILGLSALKLGAKAVYCIDIDEQALAATQNNAKLNEFANDHLFIGFPQDLPNIKTDILVANILAQPLIELKDTLKKLLKPKSFLILSGILKEQSQDVIKAFSEIGLLLTVEAEMEEWVCLSGFNAE